MSIYTATCTPIKTILSYPISLDEVKSQMNWDKNNFDNDPYIESIIIPAATLRCSNFINADIAPTLNVLSEYDFSGDSLRINRGYFISLSNIITDSSSLITDYELKDYQRFFTIDFYSKIDYDPLKIEFITGFSEGKCPTDLKIAILMSAADAFGIERTSYILGAYAKKTDAIEALLWPYKINY